MQISGTEIALLHLYPYEVVTLLFFLNLGTLPGSAVSYIDIFIGHYPEPRGRTMPTVPVQSNSISDEHI